MPSVVNVYKNYQMINYYVNPYSACSSYTCPVLYFQVFLVFLIGIHSMQGWTVTMRHGVVRKRSTKRLKHADNLFRKNLQLKGVC